MRNVLSLRSIVVFLNSGGIKLMIVGSLLVAIFAGLVASVFAVLSGATLLFAIGLYTFVGTATVILIPLITLLAEGQDRESMAQSEKQKKDRQNHLAPSSLSGKSPVRVNEAPLKILAVDDDPFILDLIPMISEKAGFSEITAVESSAEALELIGRQDVTFDCFLLDISLPGMDGIELCRQVRTKSQYKTTPIIMLTARRDIKNMGKAFRAGAIDYATKPFDIHELGERLQTARHMIETRRMSDHSGLNLSEQTETARTASLGAGLPDALQRLGNESLVSQSALWTYLTQLPRKDIDDVRMFAARLEGIEELQDQVPDTLILSLLEGLSTAMGDCLGADQSVMAFSEDGTLLVVTQKEAPLPAVNIEFQIRQTLQQICHETMRGDASLEALVVGPVQLESKKSTRARTAIDHVTALLKYRALQKQSRHLAAVRDR